MKPVTVLLLLGGNMGDRARTLRRAVESLRKLEGVRVVKVSRLYETAPVGPSEDAYLNQAVSLQTSRTPMGLLLGAKILEAAAGRTPGVRWGARPLDVDLIAYGEAKIRTAWLTVPHPGTPARAFALAPLADVAPDWKPDGRRTVRELLDAMNPEPDVVRRL